MKTRDADLLALQTACKAVERSTSVRMIVANLRFLWDRYVAHPPTGAWWANPAGKHPRIKKRTALRGGGK